MKRSAPTILCLLHFVSFNCVCYNCLSSNGIPPKFSSHSTTHFKFSCLTRNAWLKTILHSPTRLMGKPSYMLKEEDSNKKKSSPITDDKPREFATQPTTFQQYLREKNVDNELYLVLCSVTNACIKISRELERMPLQKYYSYEVKKNDTAVGGTVNVQGEVQKEMDVIANQIFLHEVRHTVAVLASEEEDNIVYGHTSEIKKRYEIAFDPLDGSSNLDVNAPTGTIFGIWPHSDEATPFSSSGRSMVAAGYAVYSSSVELVISLGPSGSLGAAGFTLDPTIRTLSNGHDDSACFLLSRPSIVCPPYGPYYSLNDGREPDWPEGLRKWIHDAKRGLTPSGTKFSARYICSLCADVHRTLIKGGWAGNPRPHLRLLYEAAPLAHVLEASGGRGSDGINNLLDLTPLTLHDRVPVFLGSKQDVTEIEEYGDVQQGKSTYDN